MYLFLDDIRMPSEAIVVARSNRVESGLLDYKFAVVVRNYNEFVNWIEKNDLPELISFDNDLGEEDGMTGYDCAKWLVRHCLYNNLTLPKWAIHSANPVGVINIKSVLTQYERYCSDNGIVLKKKTDITPHNPPVSKKKPKSPKITDLTIFVFRVGSKNYSGMLLREDLETMQITFILSDTKEQVSFDFFEVDDLERLKDFIES